MVIVSALGVLLMMMLPRNVAPEDNTDAVLDAFA
jgi:hypothetical protein